MIVTILAYLPLIIVTLASLFIIVDIVWHEVVDKCR